MDVSTTKIRYQHWMQVVQDWSDSGLSKHVYCQQNGINEKQFYYYQRRLRKMLAAQAERPALVDGCSDVEESSPVQQTDPPQIVKLCLPGTSRTNPSTVSFSVNGMDLSVAEDIPTSFLTKLLEAVSHGSR